MRHEELSHHLRDERETDHRHPRSRTESNQWNASDEADDEETCGADRRRPCAQRKGVHPFATTLHVEEVHAVTKCPRQGECVTESELRMYHDVAADDCNHSGEREQKTA